MTLPQLFPLLAAGLCLPGLAADAAAGSPAQYNLTLECIACAELPAGFFSAPHHVGLFMERQPSGGLCVQNAHLMFQYGRDDGDGMRWVHAEAFPWIPAVGQLPPLELRDLDHDDVPEIVLRGVPPANAGQTLRIYLLNRDCSFDSAIMHTCSPVERVDFGAVEVGGVQWNENGFTLAAPPCEGDMYPVASTVYLYSSGKVFPLPPVQQATCPPGWQVQERWAVNADGSGVSLLKVAAAPRGTLDPDRWPRRNVPQELLPEGTAADETSPAYLFASLAKYRTNRRIYEGAAEEFAPLLPYKGTRKLVVAGGSLRSCATESRCGLLPATTAGDCLLLVDDRNGVIKQTLPAPFEGRRLRQNPSVSPESIAWLTDCCFVVMARLDGSRAPGHHIFWQAYTAGQNGKFTSAASGRMDTDRIRKAPALSLPVVRDSALWLGEECIYRPEPHT